MNSKYSRGEGRAKKSDGADRRAYRDAVRKSELRTPARAIVLALADRGMISWPSQEQLAKDVGMHPRTLRNHLPILERGGWLAIERVPGHGGRFGHNRYRLTIPSKFHQRQKLPLDQRQNSPAPAANLAGHQRQTLPTNLIPEPEREPEKEEPGAQARASGIQKLASQGTGKGGVVSPEARRKVAARLGIANADPLVRLYEAWPPSLTADNTDGLFVSTAERFWRDAPLEVRAACQGSPASQAAPDGPTEAERAKIEAAVRASAEMRQRAQAARPKQAARYIRQERTP